MGWVTINGTHILIEDGKVSKGPVSMVGKTLDELSEETKYKKMEV